MRSAKSSDGPIDLRRFRPNVHLEMDGAAWEELGWEGGRFWSSSVASPSAAAPVRALRHLYPGAPQHAGQVAGPVAAPREPAHDQCFGINARALTGGRLAAGEDAKLRPAP